jgi:hypothetical protein
MKKLLLLFFIILLSNVQAQVTEIESKLRTKVEDSVVGWKKGGTFSFNLAQTSLSNWASGGQNSIAINSLFHYSINYKNLKQSWDNSFDFGYGVLRQGDKKSFIKTDDKIDILSKYGRKVKKNLFYAGAVNFKTQMAPGFNQDDSTKISDFMAPAYIIGSIGLDYKPFKSLSLFIAPFTSKTTIVNAQSLADRGLFGVTAATYDINGKKLTDGKNIRNEFGGYVRMIYSKDDFNISWLENIGITTKLDLFSNYLKNPQNIDVNWETLISLKVNKYISMSINTHLYYDDDVSIQIDSNKDGIIDKRGPRLQFKEILGFGFSYKF